MILARNWQVHRVTLPHDCRRITRIGVVRNGDHPAKPIGGVYFRRPGLLYDLVYAPRFGPQGDTP